MKRFQTDLTYCLKTCYQKNTLQHVMALQNAICPRDDIVIEFTSSCESEFRSKIIPQLTSTRCSSGLIESVFIPPVARTSATKNTRFFSVGQQTPIKRSSPSRTWESTLSAVEVLSQIIPP